MKKIVCISGILTAILIVFVMTEDAAGKVQRFLYQGNNMYRSGEYTEALSLYEAGLAESTENKILNFNAAQLSYMLGSYENAVTLYENSEDCTDKYLNFGNIYYMAGESADEAEEKVQLYAQSLQIYMDGIMNYPQDVSLKYNYELVKEKLEELIEEQESEEEQEGDGESSDESEGEQSESGDEGEEEQSESEQSDSGDEQSESESQDGDDEQQYSQGEESDESEADMEAVERILAMLESQEEESLKNNQEVVGGNDENGW